MNNHQSATAAADCLDRTLHKSNASCLPGDEEVPYNTSGPGSHAASNSDPSALNYGRVENNSQLKTFSFHNYGGTSNGNDDTVSPVPSPCVGRRPPQKESKYANMKQDKRTRRPRADSILSMSTIDRPVDGHSVVAPDDLALPPHTLLHGSSKLAANAFLQRERMCCDVGAEGKSFLPKRASQHTLGTMGSVCTTRTLKEIQEEFLEKVRGTFSEDAMAFAEGTIPHSIVVGIVIGCVCGVVAYLYYTMLEFLLDLVWKEMPKWIVLDRWPEHLHVLWIPLATFTLSICCGLSIYYLGEPGDLAYTIQCIHEQGYKGTHHVIPMIFASQFSILAGASLGPEAPLVAICAASAGFVSRRVFRQTNRNVVRKHTFMGMAGALAAFFGAPLGGSLFALEVASRFGLEYFEHLTESIFAGEVCVVVFRSLAGLPLGQIWHITPTRILETEPSTILVGAAIGLLGAGVAFLWANFHWRLMDLFCGLGLLDDANVYAVPRILLGACGVVVIGMLVPQTMSWGEWEFGVIATLSPASKLPHIWPTTGLLGFEANSLQNCLILGFCKLLAISFSVAGGYRGGFIFPFFAAGAAFGRALCFVFPTLSPVIATLCFAAGINVAITRTALATSLILAFLAGEQFALPAVIAASVVSLFATGYVPFIKSQLARSDIDFSLYYREKRQPQVHDHVPPIIGTKMMTTYPSVIYNEQPSVAMSK
eukprot:CAMPEP_0194360172 /NCGR_PEP_ID=MMETSP0174-20130528/7453_1 /TAXON_ID=216777 /ORGANISM="Proboscia alata, Strain PI-D3" /LENGTH=708 /DNA_ID=CAMNT_0039131487 /DNA_START=322 /DNA_END=2448 /DNA_ORIENTATION=-